MTSWDSVAEAIQKAIRLSSGLGEQFVVWKHQDVNAPQQEYVTLQISSVTPIGNNYVQQTYSVERPRGQEFKIEVRGTCEATLEIECFTDPSVSGLSTAALARLTHIIAGLDLPSIRAGIQEHHIGLIDYGVVQYIPDVPSLGFRGRATTTFRFYLPIPPAVEYVGYIERMSGQVTIQGGANGDVTDDFDTGAAAPGDED